MKKIILTVLALVLVLALCACKGGGASGAPDSDAPEPVKTSNAGAPILDRYYLNDKLMIEMLVNDDVTINDSDNVLILGAESEKAMMMVMFTPGIQNLGASGEIARTAVSQSFENVTVDELQDGSLFGARSKYAMFHSVPAEGAEAYGITAATIVNQSFYNMLIVYEEEAPQYEMDLMNAVFGTINILQPAVVDQGTKTAAYESHYQEQLNTKQVKSSPKSSPKPVTEWYALPYDFYSWWGDPGDYYDMYPSWYFEPDWDYYGDYDSYWDWGWDDESDWWFYDEYEDYYDYDYYGGYDDYWDDYDPWSDPGDWDYDPWSDPGDWGDDW